MELESEKLVYTPTWNELFNESQDGDPFSGGINKNLLLNKTIIGGSLSIGNVKIKSSGITGLSASSISDISIKGWSTSLTFSSTDYNTVAWSSGNIYLSDGTNYAISAGDTGNMAESSVNYIYFAKSTSETVLQVSTTASDSVGANKILIAVAAPNTDIASDATFQVFGGKGGLLFTAANIAANSITVNELAANTISVNNLTSGTFTSKTMMLAYTGTDDCCIASTGFDATNWRGNGCVGIGMDASAAAAKLFAGNYSTHKYIRWDGDKLVVTGAIINLYLGDGHDNDIACDGTTTPSSMTKSGSTYTLNQDLFCNNLTVSSGITLKPNGYAIYVLENFTNSGTIEGDGAAGGEGDIGTYQRNGDPYRSDGGVGGLGGGSVGSTFGRALSGANGGYSEVAYTLGSQVDTDGVAGTSKNPSLGASGVAGGHGANLYYSTNLTYYETHMHGGAAGVATEELLKFGDPQDTYIGSGGGATHDIFLALRMVAYGASSGKTLSHSASSGGGGAGLGRYATEDWGDGMAHRMHTGGGGGGGGGNAGIILIAARNFVNYGTIRCNGGVGGKGGNSASAGGWNTGVGGGGGGGTGGIIIIMRGSTWVQEGTISVSGGTGGVHGNGNAGKVPDNEATDGTAGNAGKIYYFVIR